MLGDQILVVPKLDAINNFEDDPTKI